MVATAARSNQVTGGAQEFEQLASRRRRRPGWILAGFALIVASMLIGALLFTFTATTERRLALNKAIGPGHTVTAGDLKVVDVNPDSSFQSVPVDEQNKIVGSVSQGPLPDGQLLSLDLFAKESLSLTEGKAVVAAPLEPAALPPEVVAGATVRMYATVGDADEGRQGDADLLGTATVKDTTDSDSSSVRRVNLVVDENVAPKVVQASADNNLRLVVVARS